MRILELSFRHGPEIERILRDAATPPNDRAYVERSLRGLAEQYDPRDSLDEVPERIGLLEYVVTSPSSGHSYGVLLIDMGHVADAVAYWREPPLYVDADAVAPHGASRPHALLLAQARLEASR